MLTDRLLARQLASKLFCVPQILNIPKAEKARQDYVLQILAFVKALALFDRCFCLFAFYRR